MLFLRIAGRRSFSQRNAFNVCITVLLGAILSRAIVGESPVLPTLGVGAAIVILYRTVAFLSVIFPALDKLLNGVERTIINNSLQDNEQMRKSLTTAKDLENAIRKKIGTADLQLVKQVILERNGEITIIPKDNLK